MAELFSRMVPVRIVRTEDDEDVVRLVPGTEQMRQMVRKVEWAEFGTRGERQPKMEVADLGQFLSEAECEAIERGEEVRARVPTWALTDALSL